jgi:hypothetical protein
MSLRSVCAENGAQIERAFPVLVAPAVFDKLKQTRGVGLFQRCASHVFPLDEMYAFHGFLLMTDDLRGCGTFPGAGSAFIQSRTGQRSCFPLQK